MLLPALNQARNTAKQSTCRSNLKQMGTYWQIYTNDNQEYVLPAKVPVGQQSSVGFIYWLDYIRHAQLWGEPEWVNRHLAKTEAARYRYKFALCPASTYVCFQYTDSKSEYSRYIYTHFSYNQGMGPAKGSSRWTTSGQFLKASQRNPHFSQTVLFMDNWKHRSVVGGSHSIGAFWYYLHRPSNGNFLDTGPYAAHGRTSNMAFMDGHVGSDKGVYVGDKAGETVKTLYLWNYDTITYKSNYEP